MVSLPNVKLKVRNVALFGVLLCFADHAWSAVAGKLLPELTDALRPTGVDRSQWVEGDDKQIIFSAEGFVGRARRCGDRLWATVRLPRASISCRG